LIDDVEIDDKLVYNEVAINDELIDDVEIDDELVC
jgi:hypothetical protein